MHTGETHKTNLHKTARTCMSAMATVSPKIIWMAVLVTGARSKGHSSRSNGRCTARSHSCERGEQEIEGAQREVRGVQRARQPAWLGRRGGCAGVQR